MTPTTKGSTMETQVVVNRESLSRLIREIATRESEASLRAGTDSNRAGKHAEAAMVGNELAGRIEYGMIGDVSVAGAVDEYCKVVALARH